MACFVACCVAGTCPTLIHGHELIDCAEPLLGLRPANQHAICTAPDFEAHRCHDTSVPRLSAGYLLRPVPGFSRSFMAVPSARNSGFDRTTNFVPRSFAASTCRLRPRAI